MADITTNSQTDGRTEAETGSAPRTRPEATEVTVVGAGLAGAACAAELRRLGVACRVVDRGRAPAGRLASPLVHDRRVDLGAGYFTVKDDGFAAVVGRWHKQGLARPWTDTFGLLSGRPGVAAGRKSGPTRWATPGGLRSLVRDLLGEADVELGRDVTDLTTLGGGPVVLAMPDAQASRLVPGAVNGVTWLGSDPVIAVVAGYAERTWGVPPVRVDPVDRSAPVDLAAPVVVGPAFEDAAFVNDDDDLTFVADDGSRRGDRAPVLVAHTTPALARRHLEAPDEVAPVVAAALTRLLGTGTPLWTHVHRWCLAKPSAAHDATHHWDGRLGLAGDQWSPHGPPRVESAWRSGTDVARAIAG